MNSKTAIHSGTRRLLALIALSGSVAMLPACGGGDGNVRGSAAASVGDGFHHFDHHHGYGYPSHNHVGPGPYGHHHHHDGFRHYGHSHPAGYTYHDHRSRPASGRYDHSSITVREPEQPKADVGVGVDLGL